MNLRKALDKARQMRGEGAVRPLSAKKPLLVKHSPERDWKPPVYDQSRSMPLRREDLLKKCCVCINPEAPEIEAYKVLRTRIRLAIGENPWNTILVTSPNAGEGKTLTSINLALTFAQAYNQTVLLLDCDLRRQSVYRVLGLESQSGLVDFLINEKPLQEFIIWPGVEKLTLISGGPPIQNSAEILGSDRMGALLHEMKTRYEDRMVLIDAPPVLTGADTLAIAPQVDCFLMVVQEGRTRLRDVKKSLELLPREKFLGFVLNRQKSNQSPYSYGY